MKTHEVFNWIQCLHIVFVNFVSCRAHDLKESQAIISTWSVSQYLWLEMNRDGGTKIRHKNPISTATFLSKFTFWWVKFLLMKITFNWFEWFGLTRWLKPMLEIGWNRGIAEDDIYEVTNSLRSDKNTEIFEKLWQLEVDKPNPSLRRVILKVYGVGIFATVFLYSIVTALARWHFLNNNLDSRKIIWSHQYMQFWQNL